jgi:hypothetical protein
MVEGREQALMRGPYGAVHSARIIQEVHLFALQRLLYDPAARTRGRPWTGSASGPSASRLSEPTTLNDEIRY